LDNESAGAKQFAEFFPTPVIPVCYVIGLNGQPLEVITATQELSTERLTNRFKQAVQLFRDQLKQAGIAVPSEAKKEESAKSAESDNGNGVPDEDDDYPGKKDTSGMTFDEKIQYAKERLEWKKQVDAEKKKEEDRQKEIQRRNDGKAMLEAKEKQKEKELREAAAARRREKADDEAALKRLRDQIKADKEERAKKAKGGSGNTESAATSSATAASSAPINKPIPTDHCKIQCRFPNGGTLVKEFASSTPLQAIVDAIVEDGRAQAGQFFLVQSYPRKQLSEYSKSFLELGLTPSSTLLVVEGTAPSSSAVLPAAGYLQLLLGFLYTPFTALIQFFTTFFGGILGRNPSSDRPAQRIPGNNERQRDGHIGRLRNEDSSDNEGTWNGNSTQQL
jgi:hypothetical protein